MMSSWTLRNTGEDAVVLGRGLEWDRLVGGFEVIWEDWSGNTRVDCAGVVDYWAIRMIDHVLIHRALRSALPAAAVNEF